jgi:PAS domain S-box-containing protein
VIVALNSEAKRLFGYSRAELVGGSISKLMPEPDKSQHDGYLFRHEKFGTENLLGRARQLEEEKKDHLPLGKLQFEGYYLAHFKVS